jgi:hypothetical protein
MTIFFWKKAFIIHNKTTYKYVKKPFKDIIHATVIIHMQSDKNIWAIGPTMWSLARTRVTHGCDEHGVPGTPAQRRWG